MARARAAGTNGLVRDVVGRAAGAGGSADACGTVGVRGVELGVEAVL